MADAKKTVLIVDEDPDVRQFVHAVLELDGYDFIEAINGQVAYEKAKEHQPDLIVMDVQMPRKDGLSALYDLRNDPDTKGIPVILLTGVAETTGVRFSADTVEEFMGERPDAYIDKPADPDHLRETARKLLGL